MIDYKKKYLKYKLKYLNLKNNPKKNKLGFLKGGTIDELQAYLNSKNLNLKVHNVSDDGNCLFHAIIHQLNLHDINVYNLDNFSLRQAAAQWLNDNPTYILIDDGGGTGELFTVKEKLLNDIEILEKNSIDINKNSDEKWNEYIKKIKKNKCWGDGLIITAISIMLQINIIVYDVVIGEHKFKTDDTHPTITIGFVNQNHFVSLVSTKDIIKDEACKDEEAQDGENEAEKLEKALEEIKSYQPSKTADVSTEDNDSKNNDSFAKTIAISAIIVSLLLIFLNK